MIYLVKIRKIGKYNQYYTEVKTKETLQLKVTKLLQTLFYTIIEKCNFTYIKFYIQF